MNFKTILFLCLSCFLPSYALLAADDVMPKKPSNWHSGIGVSYLANEQDAGEAAASEAKEMLDGVAAKFVMILAAKPMLTEGLLDGVKMHFPAEIIYGGEVTSTLTPKGNQPESKTLDVERGVAVWALGGDVDIQVAHVSTNLEEDEKDAYYHAGLELAGKLRDTMESNPRQGKIIFTWGDQYTGSNKAFARGLNDGFGKTYPIVGAASGGAEANIIIEGEIGKGINGGVMIAGDFKLGMAKHTGPHTPATADKTLTEALEQGDGEAPFFGLVFNCRRRRIGMMNEGRLAEEHTTIMKYFPGEEFFGFYGPGEIGPAGKCQPSEGVGFSVVAALFFAL